MKKFITIASIVLMLTMVSCGSFGEAMVQGLATGLMYGPNPLLATGAPVRTMPSAGNVSSIPRSSFTDPNAALPMIAQMSIAQVNNEWEQNYQQFASTTRKADGSTYSREEFYSIVGAAIAQSEKQNNTTSSASSTSSSKAESKPNTTTSSGNATTVNRNIGAMSSESHRRCIMTHAHDFGHCNGTGICQRCDGKKRFTNTEFGVTTIVDPCTWCHGTGKCPTCGGTGYIK